jgi:GNAT superfamily N-acetyltransferase
VLKTGERNEGTVKAITADEVLLEVAGQSLKFPRGNRGCGLGTQLLVEIVRCAKLRGCKRVELDSAFHREEAHQFYLRNGFENRAYLFSKSLA